MISPSNTRTQTLECDEDGLVLSVSYDQVEQLYVQNPAFAFYFLRLASARLFQNIDTLERRLAQQTAAAAVKARSRPESADGAEECRGGERGISPHCATCSPMSLGDDDEPAAVPARGARRATGPRGVREHPSFWPSIRGHELRPALCRPRRTLHRPAPCRYRRCWAKSRACWPCGWHTQDLIRIAQLALAEPAAHPPTARGRPRRRGRVAPP